jgi:zinc D-Ala-D-Ala carboxypeptidase
MILNIESWDNDRWPNFSVNEFKCKCGCESILFSKDLLDSLQDYRDRYGSVIITSGYRCPKYNSEISTTGHDGPHTTGFAVDIATDTNSQYNIVRFYLSSYHAKGIGIAKNFTHIDFLTNAMSDKYSVRPNMWSY